MGELRVGVGQPPPSPPSGTDGLPTWSRSAADNRAVAPRLAKSPTVCATSFCLRATKHTRHIHDPRRRDMPWRKRAGPSNQWLRLIDDLKVPK